jgi:hypothetical protein
MSAESSFRGIECFQRLNFHFVSPLSRACAPDLESPSQAEDEVPSGTDAHSRAATAKARSDRSRLQLRRFRHPSSPFPEMSIIVSSIPLFMIRVRLHGIWLRGDTAGAAQIRAVGVSINISL